MIKRLGTGVDDQRYEQLILFSCQQDARDKLTASAATGGESHLFPGRKVSLDKDSMDQRCSTTIRLTAQRARLLARHLPPGAMTVIEAGTGCSKQKWLVASGDGHLRCWMHASVLHGLGPGFPPHVNLAGCPVGSLLPYADLCRLGRFPLQAVQHLRLADNLLEALPPDFAASFAGLVSLDLTGNRFMSFPPALDDCLSLKEMNLGVNAGLQEASWLDAVVHKSQSFVTEPSPMLECVTVDFAPSSRVSRTLMVTLTRRTVERTAASCVDLRGRGLGDCEIAELMPQLVKACLRRQGVGQLLHSISRPPCWNNSACKLAEHLRDIHTHCLERGQQGQGSCHACGSSNVHGASTPGYICKRKVADEDKTLMMDAGEAAPRLSPCSSIPSHGSRGLGLEADPGLLGGKALQCSPDGSQSAVFAEPN